MSPAVSVVTYTVEEENVEALRQAVHEHVVPAARDCTGYRGFLLLDQGEGKRTAILLFDSVEDVQAAQATLSPVGRDFTYALMSGPAIGSIGTVLIADGVFA